MQNFNNYSNNPNSYVNQYGNGSPVQIEIIDNIMNMSNMSKNAKKITKTIESKQKMAYSRRLTHIGFQTEVLILKLIQNQNQWGLPQGGGGSQVWMLRRTPVVNHT
jgi:hypothetical protein